MIGYREQWGEGLNANLPRLTRNFVVIQQKIGCVADFHGLFSALRALLAFPFDNTFAAEKYRAATPLVNPYFLITDIGL
jgi:hypothetical protein